MIPDFDTWRSVNLMIREHRENAALEAALPADAMLERGDMDGRAVRKRIPRAVAARKPQILRPHHKS